MKKQGKFIVFEGIDKSGKDTQIEILYRFLKKNGGGVCLTQEPTDGKYGKQLRGILEHKLPAPKSPFDFQILFTKDRKWHQTEIQKALDSSPFLICGRYKYSTLAYAKAQGICGEEFQKLEKLNSSFVEPDLIILLDLRAEKAIGRLVLEKGKPQYFEKLESLKRVREAYLEILKDNPRVVIVDASKSIEQIADLVYSAVKQHFKI
jgi:dTMP kinase